MRDLRRNAENGARKNAENGARRKTAQKTKKKKAKHKKKNRRPKEWPLWTKEQAKKNSERPARGTMENFFKKNSGETLKKHQSLPESLPYFNLKTLKLSNLLSPAQRPRFFCDFCLFLVFFVSRPQI